MVTDHLFLLVEGAITGVALLHELAWIAVFEDAALLDDDDAREFHGVHDVVGDAEEGGVGETLASAGEKGFAAFAVETAGGLIEDGEASILTGHGAAHTNALAFSSRDEATVFAETGLEAVWKAFEYGGEVGVFNGTAEEFSGFEVVAIAEIAEEGVVEELYLGIDPGGFTAEE
jgi:hypothetical protein